MSQKGWVAYVGPFNFPWGQAGSRRVYGNARSIVTAGYDVVVGCGDSVSAVKTLFQCPNSGAKLSYLGLGELPTSGRSMVRLWQHLIASGRKTVLWLSSQETKPKYVIIYGGLAAFAWHVYQWCRKNDVPIIADVVEWYDPTQMLGGRFGPFYLSANIAFHCLYPRFDGVIAISRFLANYFRSHVPVATIPPTFAFNEAVSVGVALKSSLSLVYAGTPGKKDLLGLIIEAVSRLEQSGLPIKLVVIGPSTEEVAVLCKQKTIPESVLVVGRISQEDVLGYLKNSDFSILVRNSLRFTNAGFPTKFVESMASATPVIANLTSDLECFLRDGINGFIIEAPDASSIEIALRRASSLDVETKGRMKKNAIDDAKRFFSCDAYADDINALFVRIDMIRSGRNR